MKKRILLLPIIAAIFFILPGFKSEEGFSIDVEGSYTVVSDASSAGEAAERIGVPAEEITALFENGTLKLIAVSEDSKTQIKVYTFEDELSFRVKEAEKLSDLQIKELAAAYGLPDAGVSVVINNNRKFAKTVTRHSDSGGQYTLTQYITVADGKIYLLSCTNPEAGTSENIAKAFSTLSIDAKNNSDAGARISSYDEQIDNYKTQKTLVTVLIITVCAVIALLAFGIIRKLYKNKSDFQNMG